MLRYVLAALLVVATSQTALADFQEFDFSFTGEVTAVYDSTRTDSNTGHVYDFAPPPYPAISGTGSYTVDDSGALFSGMLFSSVFIVDFTGPSYGASSSVDIINPSDPAAGIKGYFEMGGLQPAYFSSYSASIDNAYIGLYPGNPGSGYINFTLEHHSLQFGIVRYELDVNLTSVTLAPEPASLISFGLGALGLVVASRRRWPIFPFQPEEDAS